MPLQGCGELRGISAEASAIARERMGVQLLGDAACCALLLSVWRLQPLMVVSGQRGDGTGSADDLRPDRESAAWCL